MALLTEMIASGGGKRTPLMVEFPVNKELGGPFLVTSSSGFLWVDGVFPNGTVRAAVRTIPWGFLFRDAVRKVASMSEHEGWGNWQPPTKEGAGVVLSHLDEYEIPPPYEVVYGVGFEPSVFPSDLRRTEEVWVPEGWALVLPQDRGYLGTTLDFRDGQRALTLHNASRGIGILGSDAPPWKDSDTPREVRRRG